MRAQAESDDQVIAGINVTPLVDITLVLLIIFMVTAKLIGTSAVPMVVPRSAHSLDVQSPLSLELYAGGAVRIGGREVSSDAEVIRLVSAAAKESEPDLRAIIRADTSVPHGRVLRAIDLIDPAAWPHRLRGRARRGRAALIAP